MRRHLGEGFPNVSLGLKAEIGLIEFAENWVEFGRKHANVPLALQRLMEAAKPGEQVDEAKLR
jgi:hypothetical protein